MTLLVPRYVTLSEPQFLSLRIGDNNGNSLTGEHEKKNKNVSMKLSSFIPSTQRELHQGELLFFPAPGPSFKARARLLLESPGSMPGAPTYGTGPLCSPTCVCATRH